MFLSFNVNHSFLFKVCCSQLLAVGISCSVANSAAGLRTVGFEQKFDGLCCDLQAVVNGSNSAKYRGSIDPSDPLGSARECLFQLCTEYGMDYSQVGSGCNRRLEQVYLQTLCMSDLLSVYSGSLTEDAFIDKVNGYKCAVSQEMSGQLECLLVWLHKLVKSMKRLRVAQSADVIVKEGRLFSEYFTEAFVLSADKTVELRTGLLTTFVSASVSQMPRDMAPKDADKASHTLVVGLQDLKPKELVPAPVGHAMT
jgi:hypothetical protein